MGFFSVNVFNRTRLLVESDASAAALAYEKLKKAGIPCEMHTKRLRSTVGMRMDVGTYAKYNQAYVGNPQHYGYTYTISVPRKKLAEAKSALHI